MLKSFYIDGATKGPDVMPPEKLLEQTFHGRPTTFMTECREIVNICKAIEGGRAVDHGITGVPMYYDRTVVDAINSNVSKLLNTLTQPRPQTSILPGRPAMAPRDQVLIALGDHLESGRAMEKLDQLAVLDGMAEQLLHFRRKTGKAPSKEDQEDIAQRAVGAKDAGFGTGNRRVIASDEYNELLQRQASSAGFSGSSKPGGSFGNGKVVRDKPRRIATSRTPAPDSDDDTDHRAPAQAVRSPGENTTITVAAPSQIAALKTAPSSPIIDNELNPMQNSPATPANEAGTETPAGKPAPVEMKFGYPVYLRDYKVIQRLPELEAALASLGYTRRGELSKAVQAVSNPVFSDAYASLQNGDFLEGHVFNQRTLPHNQPTSWAVLVAKVVDKDPAKLYAPLLSAPPVPIAAPVFQQEAKPSPHPTPESAADAPLPPQPVVKNTDTKAAAVGTPAGTPGPVEMRFGHPVHLRDYAVIQRLPELEADLASLGHTTRVQLWKAIQAATVPPILDANASFQNGAFLDGDVFSKKPGHAGEPTPYAVLVAKLVGKDPTKLFAPLLPAVIAPEATPQVVEQSVTAAALPAPEPIAEIQPTAEPIIPAVAPSAAVLGTPKHPHNGQPVFLRDHKIMQDLPDLLKGMERAGAVKYIDLVHAARGIWPHDKAIGALHAYLNGTVSSPTDPAKPSMFAAKMAQRFGIDEAVYAPALAAAAARTSLGDDIKIVVVETDKGANPAPANPFVTAPEPVIEIKIAELPVVRMLTAVQEPAAPRSDLLCENPFLLNQAPKLLLGLLRKGHVREDDLVQLHVARNVPKPEAIERVGRLLSGQIVDPVRNTLTDDALMLADAGQIPARKAYKQAIRGILDNIAERPAAPAVATQEV